MYISLIRGRDMQPTFFSVKNDPLLDIFIKYELHEFVIFKKKRKIRTPVEYVVQKAKLIILIIK